MVNFLPTLKEGREEAATKFDDENDKTKLG